MEVFIARYYFDIEESGFFVRDTNGVECQTKDAARHAAIDALRRMAMDALGRKDQHIITIAVRDDAGIFVLQASLRLDTG
ncbi:MAG: hypothetical protein V7704_09695 [Aurantimonas endophytica]|uniref:DUF6894 family protein n=1 Tax=Aurantimonas endophytica TaxID=1522175 RepID=UPI0030017B71